MCRNYRNTKADLANAISSSTFLMNSFVVREQTESINWRIRKRDENDVVQEICMASRNETNLRLRSHRASVLRIYMNCLFHISRIKIAFRLTWGCLFTVLRYALRVQLCRFRWKISSVRNKLRSFRSMEPRTNACGVHLLLQKRWTKDVHARERGKYSRRIVPGCVGRLAQCTAYWQCRILIPAGFW